jgi:hypothetical protein
MWKDILWHSVCRLWYRGFSLYAIVKQSIVVCAASVGRRRKGEVYFNCKNRQTEDSQLLYCVHIWLLFKLSLLFTLSGLGVSRVHYLYYSFNFNFNNVNEKGIRNGVIRNCVQFKVLQCSVVFTYFYVSHTKIIVLWVIFYCCLYLNYVESSDRILDEWWMGKGLWGRSHDLIGILLLAFVSRTEEHHENHQRRWWCGPSFYWEPPGWELGHYCYIILVNSKQ